MRPLTIILAACLAVASAQLRPIRADIFSPLRNPAHPANAALARGIAIRNQFAWPVAPAINNPWIPSPIANSPAVNIPKPADAVASARFQKVQEMIGMANMAHPSKKLPAHIKNIISAQREMTAAGLEVQKEKQEAVKELLDVDQLDIDNIIGALYKIHGKEVAAKSLDVQRAMMERFDKPFLKPHLTIAKDVADTQGTIVMKIYQDLEEKAGTILKGSDFYIVAKVTGFVGDKLDLEVQLEAVKDSVQNLTQQAIERQIEMRNKMIEELTNFKNDHITSEFVKDAIDKQIELVKMGMDVMKPDELTAWFEDLLEKEKDLAAKQIDMQREMATAGAEVGLSAMEKRLEMQKDMMQKEIGLQKELMEKSIDFQKKMAKASISKQMEMREAGINMQKEMMKNGIEMNKDMMSKGIDFNMKMMDKGININKDMMAKGVEMRKEAMDKGIAINKDMMPMGIDINKERMAKGIAINQAMMEKGIDTHNDMISKGIQFNMDMMSKGIDINKKMMDKQLDIAEKSIDLQKDIVKENINLEKDLTKKAVEKAEETLTGEEIMVADPKEIIETIKQVAEEKEKLILETTTDAVTATIRDETVETTSEERITEAATSEVTNSAVNSETAAEVTTEATTEAAPATKQDSILSPMIFGPSPKKHGIMG